MLTGVGPPEGTTPPGTRWRLPSQPICRTEILVATGVRGEQVLAVAAELKRTLGSQAGTRPGPAGDERRPGHGRQRPVRVAVEGPDRVGPRRVVVEVDMTDDGGEVALPVGGDASRASRPSRDGAEGTGNAEGGDAKRKAPGPVEVLSHRVS